MGALSADRPKPLISVGGKALIDHALEIASGADVSDIVVNTHYLANQISAHLRGKTVKISRETDQLLETGGGLRNALPLLGSDPVYTLNSDAVWTGENPLSQLRHAWNPDVMDGLLLLARRSDAAGHTGSGDFDRSPGNHLTRGTEYIYLGAQILRTNLLADVHDAAFSLNVIWDMMLKQGRLFGIVHDGGWCDVGSPAGIVHAEKMLKVADHE